MLSSMKKDHDSSYKSYHKLKFNPNVELLDATFRALLAFTLKIAFDF